MEWANLCLLLVLYLRYVEVILMISDLLGGDTDEVGGMLGGVADGRGGADELRIRAVEPRDAPQSGEHMRNV